MTWAEDLLSTTRAAKQVERHSLTPPPFLSPAVCGGRFTGDGLGRNEAIYGFWQSNKGIQQSLTILSFAQQECPGKPKSKQGCA